MIESETADKPNPNNIVYLKNGVFELDLSPNSSCILPLYEPVGGLVSLANFG